MNLASWIIVILFVVAFAAAIRHILRNGVCSECKGGCRKCSGGSHCTCEQAEKMLQKMREKKS